MIGLTLPSMMFLSARTTDMRKSIDGLCGEVLDYLGCDSVDGRLFIFYNRRRDKLKLLFLERDGYWVLYKRLEVGHSDAFNRDGLTRISLDGEQLHLIFSGIDLNSVKTRKILHCLMNVDIWIVDNTLVSS
jgi:transposase